MPTRYTMPLMLTRAQWGMPGPVGPPLTVPVGQVFLHHTDTKVTAEPVSDAQQVARIGLNRFGLMSYSVLVHPARVIFWAQLEHRGAHTLGYNSTSVGIGLVGDYALRGTVPDSMVFDACVALSVMRSFGIVTSTPTVTPHRAVRATMCPGGDAVEKVLPFMRAVAADPSWRP